MIANPTAAAPAAGATDIDRAINGLDSFLHRSPIRNPDGSVNSGYDWKDKRYPFVYHEITGYAISVGVNCLSWWGSDFHRRTAEEAIRYLESLAHHSKEGIRGLAHKRDTSTGSISHRYYSFDNAIILQGLAAYLARFPSESRLAFLKGIAAWLVEEMQLPDGSFLGYIDEEGRRRHVLPSFEGDHGCLHAKHAIGLLRAAGLTGEARFSQAAARVCDWVLGLQAPNGLFWTNTSRDQVFTHAHCYAVEGLIYAHCAADSFPAAGGAGMAPSPSQSSPWLEAAIRGAEALAALQRNTGALPHTPVDNRPLKYSLRSKLYQGSTTDATSQAVKIWLALDLIRGENRYQERREAACRWLLTRQAPMAGGDERARGGMYYHGRDYYLPERLHRDMNTWASQFAMGAMMSQQAHNQSGIDLPRVMREWL